VCCPACPTCTQSYDAPPPPPSYTL
jgi:hypothetical protein